MIKIEEHLLKASDGAKIDFKTSRQNYKNISFQYKYIDQRHLDKEYKYLNTLKPHGAFVLKNRDGQLIVNSVMVLEEHLTSELSIKALLNRFVKSHLEIKLNNNRAKSVSETLFLLVEDDSQKLLAEPYLMRVKKDYEIDNFKIVLVTPFELFENMGEQVNGFIA